MARLACEKRDHWVGLRNSPLDSDGYVTAVGEPKPNDRRYWYCLRGSSSTDNLASAMFDDSRSAPATDVQPIACTSRNVRPSFTYVPFSANTLSVRRAVFSESSVATINGLSVDPGSYGSVTARQLSDVLLRTLAEARTSPVRGSVSDKSPPRAFVLSTAARNASVAISCNSESMVR